MDFFKAFSTIDHKKLERYSIRGLALKWFMSYLLNRYHFIKISDKIHNIAQYGDIIGRENNYILMKPDWLYLKYIWEVSYYRSCSNRNIRIERTLVPKE